MKAVVRSIPFPARGRLLAVSDVHGNLPWLKALLAKAAFSPAQKEGGRGRPAGRTVYQAARPGILTARPAHISNFQ